MSDPPERDEPSFVTNVERSVDPRVPSPLGRSSEIEPSEVGTLPGPRLHRFRDGAGDADEPSERTALLLAPIARAQIGKSTLRGGWDGPTGSLLPPIRARLDSEAAGHWVAPAPSGVPLPTRSDTAALPRGELVGAPPSIATAAPVTPLRSPPRGRGPAIMLVGLLVVGVLGATGVWWKLGRGRSSRPVGTEAPAATGASTPSTTGGASAVAVTATGDVPSATPTTELSAMPSGTPAASGAPTGTGRRGRPRRPRHGR